MAAVTIKTFSTNTSQIEAIKACMNALKIKFEISSVEEKPYNQEFVDKILQGDEDLKNGKGRKVTIEELDKLWK
jgi:hypothetical protein